MIAPQLDFFTATAEWAQSAPDFIYWIEEPRAVTARDFSRVEWAREAP